VLEDVMYVELVKREESGIRFGVCDDGHVEHEFC
jgi:hypothetical protein